MIRHIVYFVINHIIWFDAVAITASLVFLWLIIYFLLRAQFLKGKKISFFDVIGKADISRRRSVKAWKQVLKRMDANDEANLKLAIIEADKILDEVLKIAGYKGENMSDRLKQINSAQISNIEEIWQAHKIRNRIVHEPDFHIPRGEAWMLIEIYKKSLQELGLLD